MGLREGELQALILAGGRGMRLAQLTEEAPPPLLFLPGGTILDYLLHHLAEVPVQQTAIVLQYRGDQIARHVGEHADVTPIPQYSPFTLLGALASAAPWVEGPTVVLHGNYYLSANLQDIVQLVDPARPTFFVPDDEAVRGRVAGAGLYMLPPAAFYQAARLTEADDLDSLYAALEATGQHPVILPLASHGQAIHTPADLLKINRYLLRHWHEVPHPPRAGLGYDAMNFNWIAPDADVDGTVSGLFATIAPRTYVRGSHLYNSLLLPGVQLNGSRERHAVLTSSAGALVRFYNPTAAGAERWL
jgi:NDP-sugar pyrophosphorylase family protein